MCDIFYCSDVSGSLCWCMHAGILAWCMHLCAAMGAGQNAANTERTQDLSPHYPCSCTLIAEEALKWFNWLANLMKLVIVIINISVAPSHYGHFCGTFTITVQLKMVAVRLEKHTSHHLAEVSLMLLLKLFWCWLFQTHNSAKCIFYK